MGALEQYRLPSLVRVCPLTGLPSPAQNQFGCNFDEAKIRAVADAMVSSGLHAAGYRYLNFDDCCA